MNKSLLLIITDFLLLSMLALVEFEGPDTPPPPEEVVAQAANEGLEQDLIEVLSASLEQEQQTREQVKAELQSEIAAREEALAARESELSATRQTLELTEAEKTELEAEQRRLAALKAQVEAEKARVLAEKNSLEQVATERARQLAAQEQAQSALDRELQRQQDRARALQAELVARQEALAQAQREMERFAQQQSALEEEKQTLQTNLQVAQAEREILRENLTQARTEAEIARVEASRAAERTERLAQGVTELAQTTSAVREELTEEIRAAQPVSLNTIFQRYEANQGEVRFAARRRANDREQTSAAQAVLVEHNGQAFALFSTHDTPLESRSLADWQALRAQIVLGDQVVPVRGVQWLEADTQLAAVPLNSRSLREAGYTPFRLTANPLRFPEAVLIRHDRRRLDYGTAPFQVLPGGGRYLEIASRLMGRLLDGEFNANRGDFVFAQSGELIGLMVDDQRAAVLRDLAPAASLPLGERYSPTTAEAISRQME